MKELLVRVGETNWSNYGPNEVERSLRGWEDAASTFAASPPPVLVFRMPDSWYEFRLDCRPMIAHLQEALDLELRHSDIRAAALGEAFEGGAELEGAKLEPMLHLSITPMGTAEDIVPFMLVERFLQQLFLALNITAPASFNLQTWFYPAYPDLQFKPLPLGTDLLDDALFDAVERGWPSLTHVPFQRTWEWLHREMSYDVDVATKPAQKAFFGLLRVCTRPKWDPDNILLLTQIFEGILVPNRRGIRRSVRERLEMVVGVWGSDPMWFDRLYELRSRIIHGAAPVSRPTRLRGGGAEIDTLEGLGVAALLALLQDMASHNVRAYRFGAGVERETW
jgi:hypothetical protein